MRTHRPIAGLAPIVLFIALVLMGISTISACSFYKIEHEPKAAVSIAITFANHALVKKDFVSAFKLLQEKKPEGFSVDSLKNLIGEMHSGVEMPDSIAPYMYRIQPQSETINVYLQGKTSDSVTFYNITLNGTREKGYVVTECFRNPEKVQADSFSVLL